MIYYLQATTKRLQFLASPTVMQVNGEVNFEDMNVELKLLFLKLIYGTWLGEIAKEINPVLHKNVELKRFKIQNF